MVVQNQKAVFSSPEKLPSTAPFWRVGMVLLMCVALFAGCGGGDPRLTEALENIENPDGAFRLQGLKMFSAMGEQAKPHADKVAVLLKDTSPDVRGMAISLLIDWGHSSPEIVQELTVMASDDAEASVRVSALEALSKLGAQDEFLKACKAILAGDDAYLKREAIYAIGQSSQESVTAMKAELEAIAGGSDKDLATEAKGALGDLK